MHPDWVDVFPIKNGDIPASYVSLPERNPNWAMEKSRSITFHEILVG